MQCVRINIYTIHYSTYITFLTVLRVLQIGWKETVISFWASFSYFDIISYLIYICNNPSNRRHFHFWTHNQAHSYIDWILHKEWSFRTGLYGQQETVIKYVVEYTLKVIVFSQPL